MSNPMEALPSPITNDSIQLLLASKGLPKAVAIEPLKVTAAYHTLYLITLPMAINSEAATLQQGEHILRVSGHHLPVIKTKNEVGIMSWLHHNTSIPVPRLTAWDASEDNPIGHEYTLLAKAPGVTLSDVYAELTEKKQDWILQQLVDVLIELHSSSWGGIGGLTMESDAVDGKVVLSQIVDEDFWQTQDIAQFWNSAESIDSLNINGPYNTYLDLVSARIRQSAKLIQRHDSLSFMCDILPRLEALLCLLDLRKKAEDSDHLNRVEVRLAHKDLHFANILIDPATANITAILDWEFAGVVPFIEWNPHKSFLWNTKEGLESLQEKQKWMKRFEDCCRERGVSYILKDAEFSSPLQESLHKIHNYLRAIVEVSPRGQRKDLVGGWKDTVLENLARFGV